MERSKIRIVKGDGCLRFCYLMIVVLAQFNR